MAVAFSDQALKGLEQYVLAHVQSLVTKIRLQMNRPENKRRKWSKALDMQKWCNWLVFDIMGDLVSLVACDSTKEVYGLLELSLVQSRT